MMKGDRVNHVKEGFCSSFKWNKMDTFFPTEILVNSIFLNVKVIKDRDLTNFVLNYSLENDELIDCTAVFNLNEIAFFIRD